MRPFVRDYKFIMRQIRECIELIDFILKPYSYNLNHHVILTKRLPVIRKLVRQYESKYCTSAGAFWSMQSDPCG